MISSGLKRLSIIRIYELSDITRWTMRYLYPAEFLLSNHCNSGDDELDAAHVVCGVPAALFGGPGETGAEYFVRQTTRMPPLLLCFGTDIFPPQDLRLIGSSILNQILNSALKPTLL